MVRKCNLSDAAAFPLEPPKLPKLEPKVKKRRFPKCNNQDTFFFNWTAAQFYTRRGPRQPPAKKISVMEEGKLLYDIRIVENRSFGRNSLGNEEEPTAITY